MLVWSERQERACTSDPECDDSLWCNGVETCNIGLGECEPGADPCPEQSCDEYSVACTDTVLSCRLAEEAALPDGGVSLDLVVQNAANVGSYETKIWINRTSGSGTVSVGCPGGVEIDQVRSDYIFFGGGAYTTVSCSQLRAGAALGSGLSVNVGETEAYLAEYALSVSSDAAPGSTFEVSIREFTGAAGDRSFLREPHPSNSYIPLAVGSPCILTIGECETAGDCDDGVGCTVDACDGASRMCTHTPDHGTCDNAIFCDGTETCDALLGCQSGAAPTCEDGVACTVDTCDGGTDACAHSPNDALCDNSVFCDGAEVCEVASGCIAGSSPGCGDGVDCTDDSCDAVADECINVPNDENCLSNGLFCDGEEVCEAGVGCVSSGDPCAPGAYCNESTSTCDECFTDPHCVDLLFCNGDETCEMGVCQAGAVPCADECEACAEDTDTCDWCMFDLNRSQVIDGLDFAFFAGCFGACHGSGSPCRDADFDGDGGGCVGGGDFGVFSGCFGLVCGDCNNCWGLADSNVATTPRPTTQPVELEVVVRDTPFASDHADVLPDGITRVEVGATSYLEVWASAGGEDGGLASVYVDIEFEPNTVTVAGVIHTEAFGLLTGGSVDDLAGKITGVGGCSVPGIGGLGVVPRWVRVAVLEVSGRERGHTVVTLEPAEEPYSLSVVGRFGSVPSTDISWGTAGFKVVPASSEKRPGSLRTDRGRHR